MKKLRCFFAIAVTLMLMQSCESYYVSDNFPKEKFFSYIPYVEGEVLHFSNGGDTIMLTAKVVQRSYLRGERRCDCGIETATSSVNFVNDAMDLWLTIACYDRQRFEINLWDELPQNSNLGSITQLGEYNYKMESVTDEIFNLFTEEVKLFAETASVKQQVGLMYFTDKNGVKWEIVENDSVLSKYE